MYEKARLIVGWALLAFLFWAIGAHTIFPIFERSHQYMFM